MTNEQLEKRIWKQVHERKIKPAPMEDSKELCKRIQELRKYNNRVYQKKQYNHNLSSGDLLIAGILALAATGLIATTIYHAWQYFAQ